MRKSDRAHPWWRRMLAALAPTVPDGPVRLALHYVAEAGLAQALERDAQSLARYPQPRIHVLKMAERARDRAHRIRRALEAWGYPVTESDTTDGVRFPAAWDGLRASVSELNNMSETYLADGYAMERGRPEIATLLHALHRESARDRRDLIWTLRHLPTIPTE